MSHQREMESDARRRTRTSAGRVLLAPHRLSQSLDLLTHLGAGQGHPLPVAGQHPLEAVRRQTCHRLRLLRLGIPAVVLESREPPGVPVPGVYASTAFGWVYVMRHLKLATIGAVYSVSMILLLTGVGVAAFRQPLNAYEVAGLVMAIGSLVLLMRFA